MSTGGVQPLGSLAPTHGGIGIDAMDSLQRDMLGALDFDQKKQQVNDAKLRAVAQRVEYDDFEKLVLGAHLKPVKPRSQHGADTSKPFDCFVLPKYQPKRVELPAPAPVPLDEAACPQTSNDFLRAWRRQLKTPEERCMAKKEASNPRPLPSSITLFHPTHDTSPRQSSLVSLNIKLIPVCPITRFAFIRRLEPENLPSIFRTELEPNTFDGIIDALRVCVLEPAVEGTAAALADHSDWILRLLTNISRISRFELTLDFADKSETPPTNAAETPMKKDEEQGESKTAVLRKLYEV
ncbi:MAG: hypothetical protein SGPRY_006454 [Prymnesium sp.]